MEHVPRIEVETAAFAKDSITAASDDEWQEVSEGLIGSIRKAFVAIVVEERAGRIQISFWISVA